MPNSSWIETLLARKSMHTSFEDDMKKRILLAQTASQEAVRKGDLNAATLALAKADAYGELISYVKRCEEDMKHENLRQIQKEGGK